MLNTNSFIAALVLFALIANAYGVCEDDLVPLEVTKLPAEWNIGNIPHLFFNSEHLRGAIAVTNGTITGLDTVVTSLYFCPVTMTIHGKLTARRVRLTGGYVGNLDYLTNGQDTCAHGQGDMDFTVENVTIKNLVAPVGYSTRTKRMQIDSIRYEATETFVNPKITGVQTDHLLTAQEYVNLDQSNSLPTVVEFVRSVINSKVQNGILKAAARTVFVTAIGL